MRSFVLITIPLALSSPVWSASDAPQPNALESLRKCNEIVADVDRLTCYDRAAKELDRSIQRKEILVFDQQEVRKTKRSLFGFSLPRLSIFGDGDRTDAEEISFTQLDTTVKSVRALGYGKYSFTIAEGAVWQTTESGPSRPEPGSKVTIKRASLGSYFIRFENWRAVRGMRVG